MIRVYVSVLSVLCVLFYTVGAVFVYRILNDIATSVPVEATVVYNKVIERRSKDSEGRTDHRYEAVVHFNFHLDGTKYTGDKIRPGKAEVHGSKSWAEHELETYQIGTKVKAFAPKEDPSRAFLLKKPNIEPLFLAILPVGLSCLFIIWLVKTDPPVRGQPTQFLSFWLPMIYLFAGQALAIPWVLILDNSPVIEVLILAIPALFAITPALMVWLAKRGELLEQYPYIPK